MYRKENTNGFTEMIFDAMEGWGDPVYQTYNQSDIASRPAAASNGIYQRLQKDALRTAAREYFENLLAKAKKSAWKAGEKTLDDLKDCLDAAGYNVENFSYEKTEGKEKWRVGCQAIGLTLLRIPGLHDSAILSLEIEGTEMRSRNHAYRNIKLMVLELLKAPEKAVAALKRIYREITAAAERDNAFRDRIAEMAKGYIPENQPFTLKEYKTHSDIFLHLDGMTELKFKVALEEEQCKLLETRLKNQDFAS